MISVIIATKNGSKTISKAIDSVLSQSVFMHPEQFKFPEILVVSDGSTDGVEEYLHTKYPPNKFPVKVFRNEESVGPGAARKIGITHSEKDYIAILDDDDWWINPKKLENQVSYLKTHHNVVAVGAEKTEFVTEEGKHITWVVYATDPEKLRKDMLVHCPIINSSVLFRRSAYHAVGGYSTLRLAEDYDLWLRLGRLGDIANIPDTETSYTVRKNSASGSNGKNRAALSIVVFHLVQKYKKYYPNYTKAIIVAYLRIFRKKYLPF